MRAAVATPRFLLHLSDAEEGQYEDQSVSELIPGIGVRTGKTVVRGHMLGF